MGHPIILLAYPVSNYNSKWEFYNNFRAKKLIN